MCGRLKEEEKIHQEHNTCQKELLTYFSATIYQLSPTGAVCSGIIINLTSKRLQIEMIIKITIKCGDNSALKLMYTI